MNININIINRYTTPPRNTPTVDFELNINREKLSGSGYWSKDTGWEIDYKTKYEGLLDAEKELVLMTKETCKEAVVLFKETMKTYEANKKAKRSI